MRLLISLPPSSLETKPARWRRCRRKAAAVGPIGAEPHGKREWLPRLIEALYDAPNQGFRRYPLHSSPPPARLAHPSPRAHGGSGCQRDCIRRPVCRIAHCPLHDRRACVRVWRGACRPAHGPRRSLAFNPLTLEEAMQWEGPAEVPVDLILFRWINFHLGKVLLPRLRLAPSSVRLPQRRRTALCWPCSSGLDSLHPPSPGSPVAPVGRVVRRCHSSRFEAVTPRWLVCVFVCLCCRRIGRPRAGRKCRRSREQLRRGPARLPRPRRAARGK